MKQIKPTTLFERTCYIKIIYSNIVTLLGLLLIFIKINLDKMIEDFNMQVKPL